MRSTPYMYHAVTLTVRHTSDNRHFSDEFCLRKLPNTRFVRKLFYAKEADLFASAANCMAQKWQVHWYRKASMTVDTFKRLRSHDISNGHFLNLTA